MGQPTSMGVRISVDYLPETKPGVAFGQINGAIAGTAIHFTFAFFGRTLAESLSKTK